MIWDLFDGRSTAVGPLPGGVDVEIVDEFLIKYEITISGSPKPSAGHKKIEQSENSMPLIYWPNSTIY